MTHVIDAHVGKRIRHQRWIQGITQQKLAESIGIKFQQIQKYETGDNRVSASRLWDIATALGVQVEFFFEGADGGAQPDNTCDSKDEADLLRYFRSLSEPQKGCVKTTAFHLAEANQ
ncbi:MAG: helix-turn-helix domain-containing protein [Pelagimonas sp.]|uniref:helix-turn-helix domain-containing protein n=1 Tax=Pelagimonas sp. TaxID=2073170 RepID=UPI003D6BD9F0